MLTSHRSQISSFPFDSHHQTAGSRSNKMPFDRQLLLANHLDGGGEGHADLLRVIGEEAGSCGLDLPGSWGGLGVEVSRLTCQSHKRDIESTCQSNIGSNSACSCCQSDVTGQTAAGWARRLCTAASHTAGHRGGPGQVVSNLTSVSINVTHTSLSWRLFLFIIYYVDDLSYFMVVRLSSGCVRVCTFMRLVGQLSWPGLSERLQTVLEGVKNTRLQHMQSFQGNNSTYITER